MHAPILNQNPITTPSILRTVPWSILPKHLLLSKDHSTNTQASIISQFDEVFVSTNLISLGSTFSELIYQINKNEPSASFAENYIQTANEFLTTVKEFRKNDLDT